ncbi:MAG TPA: DNA internalization-related competence protein ComEC/Rec2 [Solirubrobacteraceae bacterium]
MQAHAILAEVRARPWHGALGALVIGLVAGPRLPVVVVVAAVVLPALGARAAPRVVLVLALLTGALIGQARMQAIDATRLGPRIGHAVSGHAVLLEAPRRRPFGMRVATVRMLGERVLLRAGRHVRWPTQRVGSVLAVRGGLEPLPPYEGWLRARGVHAQLRADALASTGLVRGGPQGLVDRMRERAEHALRAGVPSREGALLRGMALGDDAALPDHVRSEFRASGLSHLVAASGQNVMLLAALVLAAAAVLGIGLRTRLVLVLAMIALYVPLAGAGASIQRAGVMGAAGVVAILAGRPAARWYALLLSAAVTLALNPHAIEDVGWQLSFAAVLAILLMATRLRDALADRGLPRGLAEATALTAAATLGTAPLIAVHFGQTSLVSLPANVAAAPAVAPAMWLGMLAAVAGQVSAVLAAPFTALAAFPVAYVMWVAHVASSAPDAQVAVPVALVTAVCVAAAVAIAVRRARPFVLAAVLVAIGLGLALPRGRAAAVPVAPVLRITFLDVGQGDATLIQRHGAAILVDTGPPDGPILTRLRRAGVRRLDLLVITHAQEDHDGAAAAVLRAVPVSIVLDGRDGVHDMAGARMAAEAGRRRVRLVAAEEGQLLGVGGVAIRVLWPEPGTGPAPPGGDPNQRAVVAEASADGVRMLLTADAESDVLGRLDLSAVDVLKVSHHGSADPGLPALLARLHPRLAAIEVGRHNPYGHPAASTLQALRAARVAVVRTDRDGSVQVEPAGEALRVRTRA